MKHLAAKLFLFLLLLQSSILLGQIPSGYYTSAEGKTGYALKTELSFIIDGHTDRGYSALWTLYYTSDDKPNGKVWDMYSDIPGGTPPYEFTFGNDQCGNYSGEGSCYNREHSFPKSWFNDGTPMINDAHHIVPTDGYVNGRRGNFPFGETNGGTYTSQNGSKVGSSTLSGYSGTVFEPIDEYKGDFARIYFYMATRYESQIDSWSSDMLNGTEDQVYNDTFLRMLLSWHDSDPVSQKEVDRNNDVYDFQGNRNPFVDHPEWVSCIWEGVCENSANPSLSSSANTLNFSDQVFGNSSETLSFTLTGEDLTEDITISSSDAEFTIAIDSETNFGTSKTISPDNNGEVSATIYVKFAALSNTAETINGQLSITQSEVDNININLSGGVLEQTNPVLEATVATLDFSDVEFGSGNEVLSFSLTGANLTETVNLSSSEAEFTIAIGSQTNFESNKTITPENTGEVSETIFIKFEPVQNIAETINSTLNITQSEVSDINIDLNATVIEQLNPQLTTSTTNLNFNAVNFGEGTDIQSFEITGSDLSQNISLSAMADEYTISINDQNSFSNAGLITPESNGDVQATVFVKFEATQNIDATINSFISIAQAEVENISVSLSGEVVAVYNPLVNITGSLNTFNTNIFYTEQTEAQTLNIQASGIRNRLKIAATNNFQTGTASSNMVATQELVPNQEGALQQEILVNYLPENYSEGTFEGMLYFISESDTVNSLALNATITDQDTSVVISFFQDSIFASTDQSKYEVKLYSQRKLDKTQTFEIRLNNFTNVFFPAQFTVSEEVAGTRFPLTIEQGDSVTSFNISLDTAKLKTDTKKFFTIDITSDESFEIGDIRSLYFEIAPFQETITSNKHSKINSIELKNNPVHNYLTFNHYFNQLTYDIFNHNGKKVKSGRINTSNKIELQLLPDGLYIIKLFEENTGETYISKFLKN
jgi:endonuclease I